MKKSNASCRSSDRRGFVLLEVAIYALVAGLALITVVQVMQAQRRVLQRCAGLPALNSTVDSELKPFLVDGTVPSTNPGTQGTTDAGETIIASRATSFDAALGLRSFSASCYTQDGARVAIGSVARLEPLPVVPWRPHVDGLPGAADTGRPLDTSTHLLSLVPSSASKGKVAGAGMHPFGSTAPIVATPFPGRTFVQWSGTAIVANRNSASTTVTIDEDRTLTAVFAP